MSVILAVGAHPDDIEDGAGATLARHALDGDEVHFLVLATQPGGAAEAGRMELARAQAEHAAKIIGAHELLLFDGRDQNLDMISRLTLIQWIETVLANCRPSIVYTHHGGDRNLDHCITHDAVLTACRPVERSSVREIYTFEVPSSTEWGTGFEPNVFVNVDGEPWARKVDAIRAYVGELRFPPHPRAVSAIDALSVWRGATAGLMRAEAFRLIRSIR